MTSFKAAKILVGLSCLTTTVTQARVDFCGSVEQFDVSDRYRYDCIVEEDPLTTCGTLFFTLAAFPSSNSYTKEVIKKHGKNCCDPKKPKCLDNPFQEEERLKEEGLKGDQAYCRICGNNKDNPDEFPGLPDVAINARYIGGPKTCEELYDMGVNQHIPSFMCGPLQDYAFEACGCGEFEPEEAVPPSLSGTEGNDEDEEQDLLGTEGNDEDEKQDAPCASFTTKDTCKEDKSCKWEKKKEECQDKKRHLRREQR